MRKATPSEIADIIEESAEHIIHDFVLNKAALGVYDSTNTRRPKAEALGFEIELLEIDVPEDAAEQPEFDIVVHAAGPFRLRTQTGEEHDKFLRASLTLRCNGQACHYADGQFRAVYIEDPGNPNGGCKETAALANA